MRLGIKGKQVLGVTTIVGAVVVGLSLMYLARLAQVSLDESRARAELLANAVYHRARQAVADSPGVASTVIQSDPGLRSILEASLYDNNVTFAAIVDGVPSEALDPEVERVACERLGLEPDPVSTQVIARDRHAELLYACAAVGTTVETIALEIRHLQRTELREAEEPFRAGKQKGSSAMPHKRNPVKSEQLCGLARILRANLQAGLENVALWHERDISHSSVERVILPDSCILTHYVMVQAERLVDGLVVYPERMLENLDGSFGLVFSQPVLLALVESGLSRDDAYRLVQRNAMATWEQRRPFIEVLRADAEVAAALPDDRLVACFDLTKALANTSRTFEILDATLAQPLA